MKKHYLLFLLFYFYTVFAQKTMQSGSTSQTEAIDKKIKKIEQNLNTNPKQQENQLLQLKAESEQSGYDWGVLQSGNYLMRLYGFQSRNKETVQLGEQLKKIAQGKKDKFGYITSIYRRNALALGYLGLDNASMKDFKTAIKYAQFIDNNDNRSYLLSLCYENMTVYYINKRFESKKNMDTVLYYLIKSSDEIRKVRDNGIISNNLKSEQLAFVNMRLGIYYLEQAGTKENLNIAEKYLLQGLKIHENKKYNIPPDNKIMMLNQVSWLYLEKKEYQKSIDYALGALALEKQFRDPYHRVESYEFLADSYREAGEKEKSRFYMDKYTYLQDSISYIEKNEANTTMKKMVAEVDKKHEQSYEKQLFVIVILVLTAAIVLIFLWKRKEKIHRRKYEEMIAKIHTSTLLSNYDTPEISGMVSENNDTRPRNMPDETVKVLLQKLKRFETSERYLKNEVSLTWLANNLNTKTKYLSEIIKLYRDKNFADYVNGLRIDYIVHKLYNEPKYRQYKISSLAEECGFASSRVFVNAFKKINEVPPSYFIDQLKQDESAR